MTPYYQDSHVTIYHGDALTVLRSLPADSVQCCVTSPPYWGLRDYGNPDQLGLEPTPEEYVARLVEIFREVRRVLRDDGTVWLNLGDSYVGNASPGGEATRTCHGKPNARDRIALVKQGGGLKPKDLVGIPWRVAFALQADGWWLRSDIIWAKPNPMPESVTDRPTKAHEYVFLLAKSERYFWDQEAVREAASQPNGTARLTAQHKQAAIGQNQTGTLGTNQGLPNRNIRTVWQIATQPYPEAHFATFPPKLVEPCVKAGCPKGRTVLDPFAGSGTTLAVAKKLNRRAVGIELNRDYCGLARRRLQQEVLELI